MIEIGHFDNVVTQIFAFEQNDDNAAEKINIKLNSLLNQ